MRNPYHYTLGVFAWIGVAALSIAFIVLALARGTYDEDTALVAQASIPAAFQFTLLTFIAWLIVGGVTWKAPATVETTAPAPTQEV